MNIDDTKQVWLSDDGPPWRQSPEELLAFVRSEARRFDRQILLRDLREVIAAALAAVLIAPTALHANLLTRVGTVVVIASLALIVVRLARARHAQRRDAVGSMHRPVALVLRSEKAKIDGQIRLLETVLWWYVGPLWLGLAMVIVGRANVSWAAAAWTAALTASSILLVRVNASVARRYLGPRRDRLARLVEQLDPMDTVVR
jgi:hypothetical protein